MHIPKAPGFSSMLKDGARVSKVSLISERILDFLSVQLKF